MRVTISPEIVESFVEKQKLFFFLNNTFTKTFFKVEPHQVSMYLKGPKGILRYSFPVQSEEVSPSDEVIYAQLDFPKWNNAILKLRSSLPIQFEATETAFTLSVGLDTITLGIITYKDITSSEIDIINNFIPNTWKPVSSLVVDDMLSTLFSVATSVVSPVIKNNAIAIRGNIVIYSDRSIIVQARYPSQILTSIPATDTIILPKYTVDFMQNARKYNTTFYFSADFNVLFWEANPDLQCILAGDPIEIAIPSPDDIRAITPKDESCEIFEIAYSELKKKLDFFNGFYERSIWKPITFDLQDSQAFLRFSQQTTELQKEITVRSSASGSFTISSENLGKVLSQVDTQNEEIISFKFDKDSLGVTCIIGENYLIIFAKIS